MSGFIQITGYDNIVATLRAHNIEPEKQQTKWVPATHTNKDVARFPDETPHPGGHVIEGGTVFGALYDCERGDYRFQFVDHSANYQPMAILWARDIKLVELLPGRSTKLPSTQPK